VRDDLLDVPIQSEESLVDGKTMDIKISCSPNLPDHILPEDPSGDTSSAMCFPLPRFRSQKQNFLMCHDSCGM
jgi:hypothetical protein